MDPEAGIPEEIAQAAAKEVSNKPEDLIVRLNTKYRNEVRKGGPNFLNPSTFKDRVQDEVSGELAQALLNASADDRVKLINGIRQMILPSVFHRGQTPHQFRDLTDLMGKTMFKMAELSNPQQPRR